MSTIVWSPTQAQNSQMAQFMTFAGQKTNQIFHHYEALHRWSVEDPSTFWMALCEFFKLPFIHKTHEVLNEYDHMIHARWFSKARFNFAEQLLSRRDDHLALICINEDNKRHSLTYAALYEAVAHCAAGLKEQGILEGDRVAAIMANTAHTIIAMLATTSLGAIWSSCSPDFGAQAAIDRLGQIEPKLLFVCDGHQYQGKKHSALEKITQIKDAIPSLERIIICPNIDVFIDTSAIEKTLYWNDFIKPATQCDFVAQPFNHPLYILFSSGTTGKPKCIVHGAGGTLLQHMKELALHSDLRASDNLLFYTTCGWMMWNWMVSGLSLGATLTLYEGSPTYPEQHRLFALIEQEQVHLFGTSAKYLSSIEKAGIVPRKTLNLDSLRCILSTGSPLLPNNYDYVYTKIKPDLQLSSISGGTDIVSCFALGNPMLPVYKGELQCIGLGMDVAIYNDQGKAITQERGELVCISPFPSMPIGFWNDVDDKAYSRAYFERFPGVWAHGDFAERTAHHGLIIYGRSDAVLNPGGVRIGTAEIYRQVEKISAVLDSVVIGQDWEDDVRVILFVTLRQGVTLNDELIHTIKQSIRNNASPRHVPAKIIQVQDIPRTMSGKTVELAVKQVVHKQAVNNLSSLANPQALEYFKNRPELAQ